MRETADIVEIKGVLAIIVGVRAYIDMSSASRTDRLWNSRRFPIQSPRGAIELFFSKSDYVLLPDCALLNFSWRDLLSPGLKSEFALVATRCARFLSLLFFSMFLWLYIIWCRIQSVNVQLKLAQRCVLRYVLLTLRALCFCIRDVWLMLMCVSIMSHIIRVPNRSTPYISIFLTSC